MFKGSLKLSALYVTCVLVGCKSEELVNDEPSSSWELIQANILEPNCVPCHQPGSSFARQSDLILTKEVGYDQLVNRLPNNPAARNNGLERVGTKGLESLYTSYLWEKINYPNWESFYSDHPEYGELMPLGGPSLTFGELKYISDWITQGAPRNGFVADEKVLADEDRFEFPDEAFAILDPPESGIQFNLGPFDVISNHEREFFYYEPLNNNEALYVNKYEITMRPGSHHFILYDFPEGDLPVANEYRDIRDNNNNIIFETVASIFNNRFVFGTQWRTIEYTFPEGVAVRIPANWGFDLNSHYVNRTSETMVGEVSVNLHTVPPGEVQYTANILFLNNTEFQLPPNKETTLERTWTFSERRNLFQLTSHAHEHMTEFRIYIVGGSNDSELIFFTNDWEHPPMINMDPPLVLEPGQGLRAKTTYNNNTDRTLRFGLFSVDEMMIIFGAYYTD